MAIKFLESGTDASQGLEWWTSTSGTVASDTGQFRTGPRSIKFTSGAGGTAANVGKTAVLADAGTRVSFWVRYTDLPTATLTVLNVLQTGGVNQVVRVRITSAGVLQLFNNTVQIGSSGSTLSTGTWYRLSLAYTITSTAVNEFRLFLNGVSDISVSNASLGFASSVDFNLGWPTGAVGNSKVVNFDDIYVDDSSALTDPGDVRVVAKVSAAVNSNSFDTTIGAGTVNDRPFTTATGKQHAAISSAAQNYAIQTVSGGDVDITDATLVGYGAYIWAKATAGGAGTPKITANGVDTAIVLTSAAALYTNYTASASYPANAATVGMVATNNADDTFLYDCGMLIAFSHPITRVSSVSGSVASSGAAVKQVGRHLSGTITSAGVLTTAKTRFLSAVGTLTSAGSAAKSVGKALAGTITSAGTIGKQAGKALAGTVTSGGVLTKQVSNHISGAIASAGALAKQAGKPFSGAIASSATLGKSVAQHLAGTIASAGVLTRQVGSHLSGAIASSGALTPVKTKILNVAGTITSSGALVKSVGKSLAGTITSSGALVKRAGKACAGSVSSAGVLSKSVGKVLAGTITSSGVLSQAKALARTFSGSIASAGGLVKQIGKALSGLLGSSGTVVNVPTTHVTPHVDFTTGWITTAVNADPLLGASIATPSGIDTAVVITTAVEAQPLLGATVETPAPTEVITTAAGAAAAWGDSFYPWGTSFRLWGATDAPLPDTGTVTVGHTTISDAIDAEPLVTA